jgi:hypothetical protein
MQVPLRMHACMFGGLTRDYDVAVQVQKVLHLVSAAYKVVDGNARLRRPARPGPAGTELTYALCQCISGTYLDSKQAHPNQLIDQFFN